MTGRNNIAALAAIRKQLGTRVQSGSDLLRVREAREPGSATGLEGLNEALGGGLPKGQFTEIVGGRSGGAGLVLAAFLEEARRERRYVLLLDVGGGCDPGDFPERDLEGVLWVGCRGLGEAVEAFDIASRDENFSLFLLDLRGVEPSDCRGVAASRWQRILGQLRQREAAGVLFVDGPVIPMAKRRIEVEAGLSCGDLDRERETLWGRLRFRRIEGREARRENRLGRIHGEFHQQAG